MLAAALCWDWINQKLYWLDTAKQTIEVMDPVTRYRKTLIQLNGTAKPSSMALYPPFGYVAIGYSVLLLHASIIVFIAQ